MLNLYYMKLFEFRALHTKKSVKKSTDIQVLKRLMVIIIILSMLINIKINEINNYALFPWKPETVDSEKVKNLNINVSIDNILSQAAGQNMEVGDFLTLSMITQDYCIDEKKLSTVSKRQLVALNKKVMRFCPAEYGELKELYSGLMEDLKYFPVPKSVSENKWVNYIDSWGYERTYKGQRRHEGTDIMADVNKAGIYPVVSVCDGTVTNMGWLELGGYRIGITSDNGIYYYYAHLDSYADNIKTGDKIQAGQLLGFMGNTGYSKVEGTKGKFDVHLHFGIYYCKEDVEIALNPYFLLKNLENKLLYYDYELCYNVHNGNKYVMKRGF